MKTVLNFLFLFIISKACSKLTTEQEPDQIKDPNSDKQSYRNTEFLLLKWQSSHNNNSHLYYKNKHREYDTKSLKEHKSTKDMIVIDEATLEEMTEQRDRDLITQAINKEVSFEHHKKYPSTRIAYVHPNLSILNQTMPSLISSFNQLREYNDIKDSIAIYPDEINLIHKPICIPTITLMTVNNTSNQKMIILGVKTDLYQLNIFVLNEDSKHEMAQYINPQIHYPIEIESNTNKPLTFQLIVLPDIIGEIKGSIYLDIIINKKPSIIIIPILINGVDNIYHIKPLYYPNHQTAKLLSMPVQISNPHNTSLIIQEAINSFSSITLQWPNGNQVSKKGFSEPIELQAKSKKTILHLKFFKETAGVEYGLLQLKTNKDTLIIPVLVKASQFSIRPYPSYLNFGILSAFNDSLLKAIPLKLTNLFKETIDLKNVYLKYDDRAIEFITIDDCLFHCSIAQGEQREIGFVVLNPIQALQQEGAHENKTVSGKIYLALSNDDHHFSEIHCEYFISSEEIPLIQKTISISMEDINTVTINKTMNYHLSLYWVQKNYNRIKKANGYLMYQYIPKSNDDINISVTIANRDQFFKENNYQFFLPFYLSESYYSFIPVIVSDNMIDLLYCNDESDIDKCNRKNYGKQRLYKAINKINDINQRRITIDLGDLSSNIRYVKYIALINNNAYPVLVIVKNGNKELGIDLLSRDNKIMDIPSIVTIAPQSTIRLKITIDQSDIKTLNGEIILEYPMNKVVNRILINGNIIIGLLDFSIGNCTNDTKSLLHCKSITVTSSFDSNITITSIQSIGKKYIINQIDQVVPPNSNKTIAIIHRNYSIFIPIYYHLMFSKDNYMTYRELFLSKLLSQKRQLSNEILLKFKTSFGNHLVNIAEHNHLECNSLMVSSSIIDFGRVQLGTRHEAYINVTNPCNEPISIHPMLADIDSIESIARKKVKQYGDINKELSIFDCLFQNMESELNFSHAIIINQNVIQSSDNILSKEEMIQLLFEHSNSSIKIFFQTSKRILCKERFVTKEEMLLTDDKELQEAVFGFDIHKEIKAIKQLTTGTLDHYNSQSVSPKIVKKTHIIDLVMSFIKKSNGFIHKENQAKTITQQEIFISQNQTETIQPHQTITLGPILYYPFKVGNSNMTLFLKNNLTFIVPIQIQGSSGTGLAQFLSTDIEPREIVDNYHILITKAIFDEYPKGEILKDILLVNKGDLPLNYTQLSLNNDQCEGNGIILLTCSSLFLQSFESKLIQFFIKVNLDFVSQKEELIIVSSEKEERRIDIEIIIDKELLKSKHHFFTFEVNKETIVLVLLLILMIITLFMSMYDKKKRGLDGNEANKKERGLTILSNIIISNQNSTIKQQNLFIKSYRRFDNSFYEEILVKIEEERSKHAIEEKDHCKKKKCHQKRSNNNKMKQKQKNSKPFTNTSNGNGINMNEDLLNNKKIDNNVITARRVSCRTNISEDNQINHAINNGKQKAIEPEDDKGNYLQDIHNKINLQSIEVKDNIPLDLDNISLLQKQQHTEIESKNKCDSIITAQMSSFNPLATFSSSTEPTDSANTKEDQDDSTNDAFNDYNYFELSNIFTNNNANTFDNNKSDKDSNKPIDSGTEEIKFNFNSIFGSNIQLNINNNNNDEIDNANEKIKKFKNSSQSYFKAFNSSMQNQYAYLNPFTQRHTHALTDLYESSEENSEENSEDNINANKIDDEEENQSKFFNDDKSETEPEWNTDAIYDKTEGFFDERGTYKLK